MSGGAYTYNRFDLYEKKAKKDYDGDGKIESGTEEYMGSKDKAIKKAMGKQMKEDALDEKKELPDFIKKKMDEKSGKKDDDCECDHKDKKKVVKEDVLMYMLENQLANNAVSAEVLFEHISDEFLEEIEEEIMEAYQTMSPKATEMSKRRSRDLSDQEYKAAGTGDSKKTNDLMQKKIKVMDARGRHGAR